MATITLPSPLSASSDSVRADQGEPGSGAWPMRMVNALVPVPFDHFDVVRNAAGQVERVTYRVGGPSGQIVATVALGRDGAGRLASAGRV